MKKKPHETVKKVRNRERKVEIGSIEHACCLFFFLTRTMAGREGRIRGNKSLRGCECRTSNYETPVPHKITSSDSYSCKFWQCLAPSSCRVGLLDANHHGTKARRRVWHEKAGPDGESSWANFIVRCDFDVKDYVLWKRKPLSRYICCFRAWRTNRGSDAVGGVCGLVAANLY